MAAGIDNYLNEYRQEIVEVIEGKRSQENISGTAFEKLVNHLIGAIPLGRNNQPWRDKAHEELANAVIHSMWCGWLSQAKAADGRYTQDYVEGFRNPIIRAFEIGQNYSAERH